MAQINEQKISIKLSQLLRDNEDIAAIISDENLMALIEAIQS